MLSVLEHVAHRFGTQVRSNGVLCLSSNGDLALVRLFAELGWSDPQPIESIPQPKPVQEVATVEHVERAIMDGLKARKRIG